MGETVSLYQTLTSAPDSHGLIIFAAGPGNDVRRAGLGPESGSQCQPSNEPPDLYIDNTGTHCLTFSAAPLFWLMIFLPRPITPDNIPPTSPLM
jgi:hypothetical protein